MPALTFRADVFLKQVDTWVERAKLNSKNAPVLAIKEMNRQIIAEWPVKTGFSKGSWFAGLNSRPSRRKGAIGRDSLGEMNAVADRLKPGDVYYVVNTARYANRVEYGFTGTDVLGRRYDVRGYHVLSRVLARARSIARTAIGKLPK